MEGIGAQLMRDRVRCSGVDGIGGALDRVDVTGDARPWTAVDTWLVLAVSGWISLAAGIGWIAMPFAVGVGPLMDRLQYPGAALGRLVDTGLGTAALFAVLVPVLAALLPATAWFGRLPRPARVIVTCAWVVWLAVGLGGLVAALTTGVSEGVGFFLIEAAVPSIVGLSIISVIAILGAAWHKHGGNTPLWRT